MYGPYLDLDSLQRQNYEAIGKMLKTDWILNSIKILSLILICDNDITGFYWILFFLIFSSFIEYNWHNPLHTFKAHSHNSGTYIYWEMIATMSLVSIIISYRKKSKNEKRISLWWEPSGLIHLTTFLYVKQRR